MRSERTIQRRLKTLTDIKEKDEYWEGLRTNEIRVLKWVLQQA